MQGNALGDYQAARSTPAALRRSRRPSTRRWACSATTAPPPATTISTSDWITWAVTGQAIDAPGLATPHACAGPASRWCWPTSTASRPDSLCSRRTASSTRRVHARGRRRPAGVGHRPGRHHRLDDAGNRGLGQALAGRASATRRACVETAQRYLPEMRAQGRRPGRRDLARRPGRQPLFPDHGKRELLAGPGAGHRRAVAGPRPPAVPDPASVAAVHAARRRQGQGHGVRGAGRDGRTWGQHLGVIALGLRWDGKRWRVDASATVVETRATQIPTSRMLPPTARARPGRGRARRHHPLRASTPIGRTDFA